jgi:hypothetical protein
MYICIHIYYMRVYEGNAVYSTCIYQYTYVHKYLHTYIHTYTHLFRLAEQYSRSFDSDTSTSPLLAPAQRRTSAGEPLPPLPSESDHDSDKGSSFEQKNVDALSKFDGYHDDMIL